VTTPDAGELQAAAGQPAAAPALQAGGSVYALLADGSTAEIRPADPQDAGAVKEMHEAMSAENLYLRFFSLSRRSAEQEAQRVCRPASADHAALLAWLGGRLVGVASYEPAGTAGAAEVAFAVPEREADPADHDESEAPRGVDDRDVTDRDAPNPDRHHQSERACGAREHDGRGHPRSRAPLGS